MILCCGFADAATDGFKAGNKTFSDTPEAGSSTVYHTHVVIVVSKVSVNRVNKCSKINEKGL